jgi:hypothetical protein
MKKQMRTTRCIEEVYKKMNENKMIELENEDY